MDSFLIQTWFFSFSVRNHVSSICSTWGREHFKTFDGDVYQFPGLCEYNLVSDCHELYQEFSVHLKRTEQDGKPTVSYVLVTVNDLYFHITKTRVVVNSELWVKKRTLRFNNNKRLFLKIHNKSDFFCSSVSLCHTTRGVSKLKKMQFTLSSRPKLASLLCGTEMTLSW